VVAGERPAIFLDLDGTLVDIAEHPERIVVGERLHRILEHLRQACGGAVALVSGRAIASIDRHLGLPALPVAGQHGLERRTAAGTRIELPGRDALLPVRHALDILTERYPGVLVEDKGLTLAVHYRQRPALASWLHRRLRALLDTLPPGLAIQRGKRVVEIKLAGADKGRRSPPSRRSALPRRRPVFIGDDVTDEARLPAVNAVGGISVKVGAGSTAAAYRLADVEASSTGSMASRKANDADSRSGPDRQLHRRRPAGWRGPHRLGLLPALRRRPGVLFAAQ
jgi:trehalose 6-phosphate phosphatase